MTERERVARGVWATLGSDYTFDEAVSGSEAPTHAKAVKWVYEVADAALAAMDRGGAKPQTFSVEMLPPSCAPKGVPLLVSGGIAMKKTGGVWVSGMTDDPFTRELNWEPKWWSPIPQHNDAAED